MIAGAAPGCFGDQVPIQGVPSLLPMAPEIERLYRASLRAQPDDGAVDAELERLRAHA